jgi:hypothetical protein
MKLETVGTGRDVMSGLGSRPFGGDVVDRHFVLDLKPNAYSVYYKPNIHTIFNHMLNSLSHLDP